ncbi:hypothetical protein MBOL_17820 [Mycobacteroides abscessus subsp. bolletii BD]|nr:hypothetical protein MBOL_17820 [Mycobacteroides abscessus subsp. bolletii BD]
MLRWHGVCALTVEGTGGSGVCELGEHATRCHIQVNNGHDLPRGNLRFS